MYVCLCNGYNDSDIREIAKDGIHSVLEVYLILGKGPCCGKCLDLAQEIIDNVHDTDYNN